MWGISYIGSVWLPCDAPFVSVQLYCNEPFCVGVVILEWTLLFVLFKAVHYLFSGWTELLWRKKARGRMQGSSTTPGAGGSSGEFLHVCPLPIWFPSFSSRVCFTGEARPPPGTPGLFLSLVEDWCFSRYCWLSKLLNWYVDRTLKKTAGILQKCSYGLAGLAGLAAKGLREDNP